MQRLTKNDRGRPIGTCRMAVSSWTFPDSLTCQSVINRRVEHGRPLRGKSVILPDYRWPFHSVLMTDCKTFRCLATFSWILPFCGIPRVLHLSFLVKRCIIALENRNSINVHWWTLRGLKSKSCEHCSDRFFFTRLTINSGRTRHWDCEFCELTRDYFVLMLR